MSKEYIIKRGSKESGPFTFEELKDKILSKETQIFTNESGWQTADEIPEVKELVKDTEVKKAKPWYAKPTTWVAAGALTVISGLGLNERNATVAQNEKIKSEQREAEKRDSVEFVNSRV